MGERVVKVRLSAVVEDFKKGMREAAEEVRTVGTQAEKLAQVRQSMQTLGATGVAMGAALAAGIGIAVAKFAEFDEAMSFVAATGQDARDNLDALRQAALDAGAATVFSATEAANAIEEMSKAGLSAREILGGGLSGALDLAAAGGLDVADAAGIAATALKVFNLQGSDMSHVADLLAAGAGKAMGDVTDLSAALAQSGQVASATGLSIEETTATLAAFASQGLLGSDAGTSLKTALQRLTPQSAEAKAKMKELGVSAYDASGNFIGMAEFAGNLQKALRDLTPEQRNAALSVMFGSDAVRAANVLYSEGEEGIRDWISAVDDQGYAAETAATRLDNLKGDWEALSGALDTAFISMGEGANGPLRFLVQQLTDLVDGFNQLPDWAKQLGLGLGAVAAGASLAGGAVLLAIPKVNDFREALNGLGQDGDMIVGKLGKIAKIGGGILAGFAAASAGMDLLTQAMQSMGDAAEVTDNKLASASSAAEVLNAALGKGFGSSQEIKVAENAVASLGKMLDLTAKGAQASGKDIAGVVAAGEAVLKLGGELGELAGKDLPSAQRSFRMVADEAGLTDTQMLALIDKMEPFKKVLTEHATAAGESADGQHLLALALGDAGDSADSAETALRTLEGQSGNTSDAVDELADTIRNFGSAELDTRDAQRQLEQAFDDLTASIAENGATLDINEQAGRDNEKALDDLAQSTLEYASALVAQTGDQQAASAAIADGRQRLIDMLAQFGITGAEAEAYADKLGLIPGNIPTVVSLDSSLAQQKLSGLWNSINDLVGRTWNIPVSTTVVGAGTVLKPPGMASGGPVSGSGPKGVDSVLRTLAPGEHVLTASEVDAAGGHAAIQRFRSMLTSGSPTAATAGGSQSASSVQVSLAGAEITLLVDGRPMKGIIQEQIVANRAEVTSGIRNRRRSDA